MRGRTDPRGRSVTLSSPTLLSFNRRRLLRLGLLGAVAIAGLLMLSKLLAAPDPTPVPADVGLAGLPTEVRGPGPFATVPARRPRSTPRPAPKGRPSRRSRFLNPNRSRDEVSPPAAAPTAVSSPAVAAVPVQIEGRQNRPQFGFER